MRFNPSAYNSARWSAGSCIKTLSATPSRFSPVGVRLPVQGRQADVGVLEADDPLFPEVFLVSVPSDAVETHAQEQGDGQHRQSGVAPQLDIVVEHARSEGGGAGP